MLLGTVLHVEKGVWLIHMVRIEGGVTAAKGFQAAAAAAGIKYEGRDDMAMVYSETPCIAAGTFTTNVVKAAPVVWDRKIVEDSACVHAVVVNAGIANAGTGQQGMQYCEETAEQAAKELSIPMDSVLLGSTGVIGMQLPMDRIKNGVKSLAAALGDTPEDGHKAACAIMTTDTIPKEAAVKVEIDGKTVTIGGMSKGSGMIHPNMCTMLAYVTTDVSITKELLKEALSEDVKDTFNMISVDGDTSTNDTLLCLANGLAGNRTITEKNEDYERFVKALHTVNETLARMMAGDGEGASKLFTCKVIHADTKENAVLLSKSVITSSLAKAAVFGCDANWGRFLCALGYSGAVFEPEKMELSFESEFGSVLVYKDGVTMDYSEELAAKILSGKEVTVLADMKMGDAQATAWGCDLTYDYVKINADYRS